MNPRVALCVALTAVAITLATLSDDAVARALFSTAAALAGFLAARQAA